MNNYRRYIALLFTGLLISNGVDAEVFEDFESGEFCLGGIAGVCELNGFSWARTSSPGQGLLPDIATGPETPCASNCARFNFDGSAPPTPGHSELRFDHDTGLDEITVEWRQFFPSPSPPSTSTWARRDLPSNDNHFFTLLPPNANTGVGVEVNLAVDVSGVERLQVRYRTGTGSDPGTWNDIVSATIGCDVVNQDAVVRDEAWLPVSVYVKRSTGNSSDGVLRVLLDGVPVVDCNGLTLAPASGMLVKRGRFMGIEQSGFAADSNTYIDDVMINRSSQVPSIPEPPIIGAD